MLKYIAKNLQRIALAVAVLSLLVVITLANDYAHLPQKLETKVTNALLEVRAPQASVIIADSSSKLIFLDAEQRVTRVQDTVDLSGQAIYYASACVGTDGFYVSQYALLPDKRYIAQESICKYSFTGDYLGKVFEVKYTLDESRALQPHLTSLCLHEGQGYAAGVDTLKHKVEVYRFPLMPQPKIAAAQPLLTLDAPAHNKYVIEAFFLSSQTEKLAVRTNLNKLYWLAWPELLNNGAQVEKVTYAGPFPCTTNELARAMDMDQAGNLHVTTHYASHGQTFAYSWPLACKQVCFWLALCYVLGYLVYQLVQLLRRLWQQGNYAMLKHLATLTVMVAFCVGIVAFYSVQLYAQQQREMNYALRESIALLDCNRPNPLVAAIKEYQQQESLSEETSAKVLQVLEKAALDMSSLDQDMHFELMAFTKSGQLVYLQDSSGELLLGMPVAKVAPILAKAPASKDAYVFDLTSSWGMYVYGGHYLHDEQGQRVGVIACTFDKNNFVLNTLKECAHLLFILLSAVVLLGFILIEGHAALECAWVYRQKLKEQVEHREFYMARTYSFLVVLVGTVNATLFTVLVKELTTGTAEGISAYIVAGAMSIFYLGFTVGTPLLKFLNLKWQLKQVVLMSGVAMLLAYLLMYYSILQTSVVLFILGAFAINAFNQVARVYGDSLSYFAPNSTERAACNRANSVAHISGMSISTFIAGSLAQYLGNAYLELFGAATAVLFLAFCYVIIPVEQDQLGLNNKQASANANAEKSFIQAVRQILQDKLSLSVIFLLLFPCYMVQAYKSYIFPLYAYNEGIDKATISNLIVFCSAVIYYCAPLLSKFEKQHGHSRVMLTSGMVLAGTFLMFLVNNTLVWAVVTLILANLAYKCMEPSIKTYWQERCIAKQITAHDTQLMWSGFGTSFKTVRSGFICACLQAFGQALGCVALGVYVLLGTLLFTFIAKDKA